MIVRWTHAALADVAAIVPRQLRGALRERLRSLVFPGQGLKCSDPRYPGAFFLKYRNWLAMYLEVEPGSLTVIGVEYNYGQTI